jgi:Ca2+-transporting ATPase
MYHNINICIHNDDNDHDGVSMSLGIFPSVTPSESSDVGEPTLLPEQSLLHRVSAQQAQQRFLASAAFTTREFFALPRDEQLHILKTGNKVFCRAEPRDKQLLILLLEQLGEVTAMTGDGGTTTTTAALTVMFMICILFMLSVLCLCTL